MAKRKESLNLSGMSLEQAIRAVNDQYGANTMVLGSEAKGMHVSFFSWGIAGLDFATGGGIPKNRVISIIGPYSSLKTTVAYTSIASFLREKKSNVAILVDVEHSHDPKYCELLGVDEKRLAIVNPDSGEQAVDVLSDFMSFDSDLYAVVDSLAMLTPTDEIESSMDQQFYGGNAKLINRMMRKLINRMKRSLYSKDMPTTTVLCINQYREKIGVVFGNPEYAPGGKGKEYAFSLQVGLRSGRSDRIMEKRNRNGIEREVRVAQRVRYEVSKNKVSGSQFEEGEFVYFVKPTKKHAPFTFDDAETVFRYGVYYGVIKESVGAGKKPRYSFDELRGLMQDDFIGQLRTNSDDRNAIYREVLDAIYEENHCVEESEEKPQSNGAKPRIKLKARR